MWRRPKPIPWTNEVMSAFCNQRQDGKVSLRVGEWGGPCLMTAGVQSWNPKVDDPLASCEKNNPCPTSYPQLCNRYEDEVDRFVVESQSNRLTAKQRGRGGTTARHHVTLSPVTIKSPRHGEPEVEVNKPSTQLKRWVVQWRRLLNLQRLIRHSVPSNLLHRNALWSAILKAPGFQHGFVNWWPNRLIKLPGTSDAMGCQFPTGEQVHDMVRTLEACVREVEKQINNEKNAAIKDGTKGIFQDVKQIGPQPVETLLDIHESTVHSVESADSIILSSQCGFDPKLPVFGDAFPLWIEIQDRAKYGSPRSIP